MHAHAAEELKINFGSKLLFILYWHIANCAPLAIYYCINYYRQKNELTVS